MSVHWCTTSLEFKIVGSRLDQDLAAPLVYHQIPHHLSKGSRIWISASALDVVDLVLKLAALKYNSFGTGRRCGLAGGRQRAPSSIVTLGQQRLLLHERVGVGHLVSILPACVQRHPLGMMMVRGGVVAVAPALLAEGHQCTIYKTK